MVESEPQRRDKYHFLWTKCKPEKQMTMLNTTHRITLYFDSNGITHCYNGNISITLCISMPKGLTLRNNEIFRLSEFHSMHFSIVLVMQPFVEINSSLWDVISHLFIRRNDVIYGAKSKQMFLARFN